MYFKWRDTMTHSTDYGRADVRCPGTDPLLHESAADYHSQTAHFHSSTSWRWDDRRASSATTPICLN